MLQLGHYSECLSFFVPQVPELQLLLDYSWLQHYSSGIDRSTQSISVWGIGLRRLNSRFLSDKSSTRWAMLFARLYFILSYQLCLKNLKPDTRSKQNLHLRGPSKEARPRGRLLDGYMFPVLDLDRLAHSLAKFHHWKLYFLYSGALNRPYNWSQTQWHMFLCCLTSGFILWH